MSRQTDTAGHKTSPVYYLGERPVGTIIDSFVDLLHERLGAKLVDLKLFGSVARGTAAADSDIDVLVVVQPPDERRTLTNRVLDIAFDVNVANDVYISPHVLTVDILNHPIWRDTPFLRTVEKEGVPL